LTNPPNYVSIDSIEYNSTSGFTGQAKDEARLTNTELIEGRELDRMTAKYLPGYFK
jgi:hypothetical protein